MSWSECSWSGSLSSFSVIYLQFARRSSKLVPNYSSCYFDIHYGRWTKYASNTRFDLMIHVSTGCRQQDFDPGWYWDWYWNSCCYWRCGCALPHKRKDGAEEGLITLYKQVPANSFCLGRTDCCLRCKFKLCKKCFSCRLYNENCIGTNPTISFLLTGSFGAVSPRG